MTTAHTCTAARTKRRLPPEESYYWRRWAEVFASRNVPRAAQDAMRHDFAKSMLGYDKSRKEWTHREYDIVLQGMRDLLSSGKVVASKASTDGVAEEGARRRAIYNIKITGVPAAYVSDIARDKFAGCEEWEALGLPQLNQLLITVRARARSLKKKESHVAADLDDDRPF